MRLATLAAAPAGAATITVTIENLAPARGNFLTPIWVGFHDGAFDLYDRGVSADLFPGLEALAEDGATGPLSARFAAEQATGVQATLVGPGGPIAPGQIVRQRVTVDAAVNRYFSYVSMIIPGNDAFIANGNPLAHLVCGPDGRFTPVDFFLTGANVLDAGTEVDDELPVDTAFFGQTTPNTGVDENGVVASHAGFIRGGPILSDIRFAGADFSIDGYPIARITVTPIPGALLLLAPALAGLGLMRHRARARTAA